MKIVYLGTPDFAVEPLKRILSNPENQVVAVVTNNDKPVGRKQILTPPPVKQFAILNGIKVYQYDKISKEGIADLTSLNADLFITCAFGQILSQEIIDLPKLGVINIHASLLPQYRGASPIHYAILNGEKVTGITIMKTQLGIDTGDILLQKSLEIKENETCGELFDRLSVLGGDCIVEAIDLINKGQAEYKPQDNDKATYTKMIKKEFAKIDFSDSSINIVNKIRAFNPAPIAFTFYMGQPFKIFSASVENIDSSTFKVGEVIDNTNGLLIACGQGAIRLNLVQKAGGKQVSAKDFLLGNKIEKGFVFGI